jgi:tripeptide aminopeptidase
MTPHAEPLTSKVLARFLRYVRVDTTSDWEVETRPTSAGQTELVRMLDEELSRLGCRTEVQGDGALFAWLEGNAPHPSGRLGLVAHVDTSPDAPGSGVRPRVVSGYDGGEIALDPASPELSPREVPELADHVGHDVVVSDGTTLLGADDKAGVAEIVTAVEHLVEHGDLPRPPLSLGFLVDEEIGRSTDVFDVGRFGADAAYTVDGGRLGEIEDETFNAATVRLSFRGLGAHPGLAIGKMVSALRAAAAVVDGLPRDRAPETTAGGKGFIHPIELAGDVETCRLTLLVRDFDADEMQRSIDVVRGLVEREREREPRLDVALDVDHEYENMKVLLAERPEVVLRAEEAMRRAGITPRRGRARGRTDGAVLTARGLPTPNLFSGANAIHTRREWVCVQDMAAAVSTLVHLAAVWADPG